MPVQLGLLCETLGAQRALMTAAAPFVAGFF